MNDTQRERIKETLLLLESVAPDERLAWIDRRVGDDPVVKAELLSLAAATRADAWKPLVEPPHAALAGTTPTRIGPFEIESLLGQGGMANVYRARQKVPIERVVAIKVLRPGGSGRDLLARFAAEREGIARMEHRNIARLLDAGIDDEGRPFLAMELVDGPSVTEYASLHRLSLRKRVELFLHICRGVQHAHARGILHRDLKPTNILVAEEDGRPVPKIIDFGVAKLLAPDSLAPRMTQHGQLLGTLEYMSPEQLDPRGAEVDIRSDVYALGVILYELISGVRPFAAVLSPTQSVTQIHSLLTSRRPAPPGRLTQSALAPDRPVSADLDCVVLKSIEPDAAQRYQTVAELADDLERLLEDRVVRAKPPTTRYLLANFVRRNRGPVLAAAIVALSVVAGVIATAIALADAREQAHVAALERSRAEEAQKAAEGARIDSEEVAAYLHRIWEQGRPDKLGAGALLKDAAVREAKAFLAAPPSRPMVRARVAISLANPLIDSNELDLAESLLKVAAESTTQPTTLEAARAHFEYLSDMARVQLLRRDTATPEKLYKEAEALALKWLTATDVLVTRIMLADVAMTRQDQRLSLTQREAAIKDAIAAGVSGDRLAWANATVVRAYFALGEYDEAIKRGTPLIDGYVADPAVRETWPLDTMQIVATALMRRGQLVESRVLADRSLPEFDRIYGPTHLNTFRAKLLACQLRCKLGDTSGVDLWLVELDRAIEAKLPEVQLAAWRPALFEMYMDLKRFDDAARMVRFALDDFNAGKFEPTQRAGFPLAMAQLYVIRNMMPEALGILDVVGPFLERELPNSTLDKVSKQLRHQASASPTPAKDAQAETSST